MAIPPPLESLLARLTEVLSGDSRVESAWLTGSLARDEADAWSDIDLLVVVDEEDLAPCVAEYAGARNPVGETVLLRGAGPAVTAVTPDWRRYDLTFLTARDFRVIDPRAIRPLIRGTTPLPRLPATLTAATDHRRVSELTQAFLRQLGLIPAAVAREEWLVGLQALEQLRGLTIALMLEIAAVDRALRGEGRRLNARLTPSHRAALEALPPGTADRDAILAAAGAVAALFLPLARESATAVGATWPTALESATRAHLRTTLGLPI